jgi:hypothetical protein
MSILVGGPSGARGRYAWRLKGLIFAQNKQVRSWPFNRRNARPIIDTAPPTTLAFSNSCKALWLSLPKNAGSRRIVPGCQVRRPARGMRAEATAARLTDNHGPATMEPRRRLISAGQLGSEDQSRYEQN